MWKIQKHLLLVFSISLLLLLSKLSQPSQIIHATIQDSTSPHQVNVPFSDDGPNIQPAIFWFGQVNETSNYADVRVLYDNQSLKITVHIFDRLLWYDPDRSGDDLLNWDSVSLMVDIGDNVTTVPSLDSYRFDGQLNHFQPRSDYQAAFRGNGIDWTSDTIPFNTKSGWRGNGLSDYQEDRGWWIAFTIPFTSLSLENPPVNNTIWRLAVSVQDRDDEMLQPIPNQTWPEALDPLSPASWGMLHFGLPTYNTPLAAPREIVTIRHGLNGTEVIDAHVGGHSLCGAQFHPNYFTGWGDANYAGYDQINIQNQWDVADWPCFSKYFVTFPLDLVPPGFDIIFASLSMILFGNAGDGTAAPPPPSYIQILTIPTDWAEESLTWNNAPLAMENISGTWVEPVQLSAPEEYHWDVSDAVSEAYTSGQPLRLALYSADSDYHSGKYFWSTDVGDWGMELQPTLTIVLGTPCDSDSAVCHFDFLPLMLR